MKVLQIIWKEVKGTFKSNLIFLTLMCLYFYWFTTIYDPDLFGGMEEFVQNYPEALQEMVGGQLALAEFGGFIHVYLFSMAWFYFGFYYVITTANDIPKEIETKTIDLMLSKPIKRWEFSLGKFFSHVIAAGCLVLGVYLSIIFGIFTLDNIDPAELHFEELNFAFVWLFIFLITIISSSFFFSAFLEPKKSLVFSLGLMIFFYVIGVYAELFGEEIEDIQYLSVFYYFDTFDLLVNQDWENVYRDVLILCAYSIAFTTAGVIAFNLRDIPV